jgi:chitin disaccharide deacetylase
MIIITADDYGKTVQATDGILACSSAGSITSASAMVFMEDSERAAPLALRAGLEVGLHVNFTLPFSGAGVSPDLRDRQARVASYLAKNKLAQILYNPRLGSSFGVLFEAQREEFKRLYGREPDFINGHHHMHLSANMLIGGILPKGTRARRTFTFDRGEKGAFNLFYRSLLDAAVARKFVSTDCFYSILPLQDEERLKRIFVRGIDRDVEIEVHPENAEEIEFLLGAPFKDLMKSAPVGRFRDLGRRES